MLLAYVFTTFVIGIACLGALLVTARRPEAGLARAFLVLYAALTVLVLGRLLLAFVLVVPGPVAGARSVVDYLESFVGRYGVLFALPYFAHRLFAMGRGVGDRVLLAVTLVAAAGQHVTEYGLAGAWDARGDVAEDVLFAGVVVYTLFIGFTRLHAGAVYRPVAVRFLAVLVLGLPAIGWDLFLSDWTAWRVYPLWYCVLSITLTAALWRRHSPAGRAVPADWGLSAREERIVRLVQRGMSNREIGEELFISPNTVKTHLRAVFDKSGFRSRLGLVAAMGGSPDRAREDHPDGRL